MTKPELEHVFAQAFTKSLKKHIGRGPDAIDVAIVGSKLVVHTEGLFSEDAHRILQSLNKHEVTEEYNNGFMEKVHADAKEAIRNIPFIAKLGNIQVVDVFGETKIAKNQRVAVVLLNQDLEKALRC